mmetsp:Transcript_14329/g.34725  ORF Transcript_14329/g.34725 Transcript_14329/m.34725 type:complete len:410 (+) Transcript_14329:77-1306(+)
MEPASPEKESQKVDATPKTAPTALASEAEKEEPPSAQPNEAAPGTDKNRTPEKAFDNVVVSPEEDNKDPADNDGKDASEGQQDGEEVGDATKAAADQTTTASTAEGETKERTNEAAEEKANEFENGTENTTENADDTQTEVVETQQGDKISPSATKKRKLDADSETQKETTEEDTKNDDTNGAKSSTATAKPGVTLPKRPVKRARTAYFIFTDEKRPEVQALHPGEGVAAVAKALGQMWGNLSPEEKKVYQDQAAKERERVSQELEAYKAAGGKDLDSPSAKARDPLATILPVARIRKICKLDPEVRGLSKEALLLVTKSAELMLQKLGKETVKVAQLQNRRKLLPDDVAHVCAHREQFLFLKDDVKDLVRSMESSSDGKASGGKKGDAAKQAAAAGTKKLTSYFSAPK